MFSSKQYSHSPRPLALFRSKKITHSGFYSNSVRPSCNEVFLEIHSLEYHGLKSNIQANSIYTFERHGTRITSSIRSRESLPYALAGIYYLHVYNDIFKLHQMQVRQNLTKGV